MDITGLRARASGGRETRSAQQEPPCQLCVQQPHVPPVAPSAKPWTTAMRRTKKLLDPSVNCHCVHHETPMLKLQHGTNSGERKCAREQGTARRRHQQHYTVSGDTGRHNVQSPPSHTDCLKPSHNARTLATHFTHQLLPIYYFCEAHNLRLFDRNLGFLLLQF